MCVALTIALTTGACAPPPDRDTPPPTLTGNGLLKNRLADAPSAYLRRAATQPIPWQAWGDDALMRARALNRPVFVSVGYGACHWCEVMAETTLTDPQVIAALRDDYVPVKVDRDLDPALDEAWQPLLVSLTGQGGWPLHVWLTPSGEPFYATGYQPAQGAPGEPGFIDTLRAQSARWRSDPGRVQTEARRRATLLAAAARPERAPAASSADTVLQAQNDAAMRVYDAATGGRRGAPKQPFDLPLEAMLDDPRPVVRRAALHSLSAYASGALRDAVGGGFHRYCVDAAWRTPHFEKLTADNARLASLYLRASTLAADPAEAAAFRGVAAETLEFLLGAPWLPDDRVAVALPARSPGADGQRVEGGAVALTSARVRALRDQVPGLALESIGLDAPALPDGRAVPRFGLQPDAAALRALAALRADRARVRLAPPDALAVLGDQARVLSALSQALWLASADESTRWAARADALWARLMIDLPLTGPWPRAFADGRPTGEATPADVVAVGHAALDVFERTARPDALAWARRAVERALAADPAAPEAHALARRFRGHTGDASPEPSAASTEAQVLVVAANLNAPEARALLSEAAPAAAPRWTRLVATPAQLDALDAQVPWVRDKSLRDDRPTAWVCARGRCLPPTHAPEALRAALAAGLGVTPAVGRAD